MRSSWTRVAALVGIAVVALAAAVFLGKALAGGNEPSSRAEYQEAVVATRDRVDFALARISTSSSPEELVNRVNDASAIANASAEDLADIDAPNELQASANKLIRTLHAFSDELAGTADTLNDPSFAGTLTGLSSLSFQQWDALNRVLSELRSNGIDVEPLARH